MIVITVKWPVKPEYADRFGELVREFTAATRNESGCLWFEWSRSVEDPNQYVLIEGFRDGGTEEHVTSDHFRHAMATFGEYVTARPDIISVSAPGEGWSKLGELELEAGAGQSSSS